MTRRFLPIVLAAVLCLQPPAVLARSSGNASPNVVVQAAVANGSASGLHGSTLTDAEREAFRLAQQSADPGLGEQRGGGLGLLVLILVVVLIVLLIDHA
jgi:hypothetical protein